MAVALRKYCGGSMIELAAMATLSTPPPLLSPTQEPVLTWEEFERLPDSDGFHRELIEGALQLLPSPKAGHSRIASRVYELLLELKQRNLGHAYMEAGYKLSLHPPTWIEPDASFQTPDRDAPIGDGDYFLGAPNLAVEVVSPSESAKDVQRKVDLMLAAGAQAIWVIYPESRTVHVFSPDGASVRRGIGDTLTVPFLTPDWSAPVARLFAD
jgi:Uma2 family endonuclease